MISEKGNLQETLFGKVLVNLYEKKVTGILYLRVGGVLKEIYINQGKLIWAISTADEEKLDFILTQANKLDPEQVDKLKKEHHLSSTVSFFMQEKGLVTKEQVVDAFLIQISCIFSHIMLLQDGEYNFVYGLSPKKAIDLEIEIPDCLRLAIKDNFKPEAIWKFFGTEKTELKRSEATLSEETLAMLNTAEQGILPLLEEWTPIESLFTRLPGKEQEQVLRDLYMMAQSGWVDKNEIPGEKPAAPAPGAGARLEWHDREKAEDIHLAGRMQSLPELENIELDLPKKEGPIGLSLAEEDREPAPPRRPQAVRQTPPGRREKKDLSRSFPVKTPSGAKSRFSVVRIVVALVVVITVGGTLAYLYLSGTLFPKKTETIEPVERSRIPRRRANPPAGTTGSTAIPEDKNTAAAIGTIAASQAETAKIPPAQEQKLPAAVSGEKTVTDKGKLTPETITKPPAAEKGTPQKPAASTPLETFEKGNFIEAGNLWARELRQSGSRYGILLEMDCKKESVIAAYEQLTDKQAFYILNRLRNGDNCFLVMWGRFASEPEAGRALGLVPAYFRQQSNPPRVVELRIYLSPGQ